MSSSEKAGLLANQDTFDESGSQHEAGISKEERQLRKKRDSLAVRKALTQSAPEDKYNLAYYIFYLQGFGCLVPWNAFITVTAYWASKITPQSKFYNNFLPFFTTSFQIINLTMMVLATGAMNKMKITTRIGVPYTIQFLLFVAILVMVKTDITGDEFFFATLALVCASAWTQAFYQGGLFGLAGMMPAKYMQSIMGGQALGGVMVAVLNMVTNATVKDDPTQSGFIFFSISVAVLLVCVVSFWWLLRMPIVKHYTKPRQASVVVDPAINTSACLVQKSTKDSPITILKEIWPFASSVCLTFTVTLAVFPSIAVTVVSEMSSSNLGATLFVPIYCFIGFNVGDLLGRTIAGRLQWPPEDKPRSLQFCAFLRLAFIPLFMLCNVHTGLSEDNIFPRIFQTDAIPYILMLLLGTSNGYFGTLCMMYGPNAVDPQNEETAGFVMLVSMISGIAVGSFTSFVILAILCRCNSFLGPTNSTTNVNMTMFNLDL